MEQTILSGDERREKLLALLLRSDEPLSGGKIGDIYHVSRQVVVQDIALLRSKGHSIVSTPRGYVYEKDAGSQNCRRIVKVCHTDDQAEEELSTIVDLGGIVLDVMVNHRTYGKVTAPLNIKSRRDVRKFVEDLKESKSSLLSNTTSGYHFHTIEAESEDILDEIEEALKEKHFLVDFLDYETTFKQ
ncbi:transcription repressor NadR [Clostridium sp. AM42-36]|nr:transcription repressor NadR [Clostridium sp. AM42-36]